MMPVAKRSDASIKLVSSEDSQQSDHNPRSILLEGGNNDDNEDTDMPMKEIDGNGEDDTFFNAESYTNSSYPLTLGNVRFV